VKSRKNLAIVLSQMQRDSDILCAQDHLEIALDLAQQVYGSENPVIAPILAELGKVNKTLGYITVARTQFERALELYRKRYGSVHSKVAFILIQLGSVLEDIYDSHGAAQCYEDALQMGRGVVGDRYRDLIIRLGRVRMDIPQFDKSEELFQNALKIDTEAHGGFHAKVLEDHQNLASLYSAMANGSLAKKHLDIADNIKSMLKRTGVE
jgi:tetratricopeptide (TPR) repeat protein